MGFWFVIESSDVVQILRHSAPSVATALIGLLNSATGWRRLSGKCGSRSRIPTAWVIDGEKSRSFQLTQKIRSSLIPAPHVRREAGLAGRIWEYVRAVPTTCSARIRSLASAAGGDYGTHGR
jgi:hypothetical protein